MIITTFIRNLLFIRNRKKSEKSGNELSVIVPAILFVWLLQGLVNSPNVFITKSTCICTDTLHDYYDGAVAS